MGEIIGEGRRRTETKFRSFYMQEKVLHFCYNAVIFLLHRKISVVFPSVLLYN